MSKTANDRLLFELPDEENPATPQKPTPAAVGAKTVKRRSKPRSAPPESLQPYLPGLSRRGRPRVKNPIPATVRASESRKRRIEAGMKRIELLLAPETAAALERLCDYYRMPRVEVLSRLIVKAAKRLPAEE